MIKVKLQDDVRYVLAQEPLKAEVFRAAVIGNLKQKDKKTKPNIVLSVGKESSTLIKI